MTLNVVSSLYSPLPKRPFLPSPALSLHDRPSPPKSSLSFPLPSRPTSGPLGTCPERRSGWTPTQPETTDIGETRRSRETSRWSIIDGVTDQNS